jgi:hypothetical protein
MTVATLTVLWAVGIFVLTVRDGIFDCDMGSFKIILICTIVDVDSKAFTVINHNHVAHDNLLRTRITKSALIIALISFEIIPLNAISLTWSVLEEKSMTTFNAFHGVSHIAFVTTTCVTAVMTRHDKASVNRSGNGIVSYEHVWAFFFTTICTEGNSTSLVYHLIETFKGSSINNICNNIVIKGDVSRFLDTHTNWSKVEEHIVADIDIG